MNIFRYMEISREKHNLTFVYQSDKLLFEQNIEYKRVNEQTAGKLYLELVAIGMLREYWTCTKHPVADMKY